MSEHEQKNAKIIFVILVSKAYRMNMSKFGGYYSGFKKRENNICLIDNSIKFKTNYEEWTKNQLILDGKWNESKWLYSPKGKLTKKIICATYNVKLLSKNNLENQIDKFKKIIDYIDKNQKREIAFAFILKSNKWYNNQRQYEWKREINNEEDKQSILVFCLSKFIFINNIIELDNELDNFNNEFIQNLNKEICK